MFLLGNSQVSSTKFSSAGRKQEFPERWKDLLHCQYLYFYFMFVKPVPLRISILRFPTVESEAAIIAAPKK